MLPHLAVTQYSIDQRALGIFCCAGCLLPYLCCTKVLTSISTNLTMHDYETRKEQLPNFPHLSPQATVSTTLT